ncbi:hypothetical protein N7507_002505 [Penicillium longicatenatum]|nr:hypothetical protein N7507_002505 [Penicillium longicatenatum]
MGRGLNAPSESTNTCLNIEESCTLTPPFFLSYPVFISTTLRQPFSWICASLKPARLAIRQIAQEIGVEARDVNGQGGISLYLFSHGGGDVAALLALFLTEEGTKGFQLSLISRQ